MCTKFYQNRRGFVEDVTKKLWCVFSVHGVVCLNSLKRTLTFQEQVGLIRPADIVVRGLKFYHGFFFFFLLLLSSFLSFFLSFLFVSYSPRSLNGTQPKPATCSEMSAVWKRMTKIWNIPSPYKSGARKPPFSTTSQLNGNFNGLYLRTETR